jgi:hypothetical protein
MIDIANMLPTEDEAARTHSYGLYAELPDREPYFLTPAWTYRGIESGTNAEYIAKRDAAEILREFGPEYPPLTISLRRINGRTLLRRWKPGELRKPKP